MQPEWDSDDASGDNQRRKREVWAAARDYRPDARGQSFLGLID
jgi:hypothetical protein